MVAGIEQNVRSRIAAGTGLLTLALVGGACGSSSSTSPTSGSTPVSSSVSSSTTATTAPGASGTDNGAPPSSAAPNIDNLPKAVFAGWTGRRPSTIAFSGDSTNIVSGLTWSWTSTTAVGHGTWTFESCDPNCAAGASTPYPATVTLSDPVGGEFTKGIEQTSGPHGSTYDFTLPSAFINAS